MEDKNDVLLERNNISAIIDQDEKILYYEILNVYNDSTSNEGKYRKRQSLGSDPPRLIIKDDSGNEAVFYLTENLTTELISGLQEVQRAYFGFYGAKSRVGLVEGIKLSLSKNPLKILFPIALIVFIVLKAIL